MSTPLAYALLTLGAIAVMYGGLSVFWSIVWPAAGEAHARRAWWLGWGIFLAGVGAIWFVVNTVESVGR